MNKKLLTFLIATTVIISSIKAQVHDEDGVKKPFFKKENLFTGGSVGAGFGNSTFSLGLGPYLGYSLNKYVDVAVALNYNYVSQRDPNSTLKVRQSILGPGAFVRIFPMNGLFAQAQYEYNFIQLKAIYGVAGYPNQVEKYKVQSTLIGAGYASGREGTGSPYYFFSILVDVGKSELSPYRDKYGRQNPIIRTGINIPLFQGKNKGRFSEE